MSHCATSKALHSSAGACIRESSQYPSYVRASPVGEILAGTMMTAARLPFDDKAKKTAIVISIIILGPTPGECGLAPGGPAILSVGPYAVLPRRRRPRDQNDN